MRAAAAWLGVSASLALACAAPVSLHDWDEVRTPSLRILSDVPVDDSTQLARDLELFRSLVRKLTNAELESSVPTHIFVLDSSLAQRLFVDRGLAGYFLQGLRANHVVLVGATKPETRELVLHEYVHFMMASRKDILYPRWYSEGYAEFLSTVIPVDGHILVGAMPRQAEDLFTQTPWIPFEQIVAERDFRGWPYWKVGKFYAESWALVQYLHFGRDGGQATGAQMARYLERVEAGASDAEAFEAAFGMDLDTADRRVRDYLEDQIRGVRVPIDSLEHVDPAPEVRTLPRDEVGYRLGELALARGENARAERFFATSVALRADHPRYRAALGTAHARQEHWDEAEAHLQRALELAPDDPVIQLEMGEFLHAKALGAGIEPAERDALLREARRHYVRSQELDPDAPETYAMYGRTFLAVGQDPAQGVETLEHAHQLLRPNGQIRRWLAKAYAMTGQEERARRMLERMLAWSHEDSRDAHSQEAWQDLVKPEGAE